MPSTAAPWFLITLCAVVLGAGNVAAQTPSLAPEAAVTADAEAQPESPQTSATKTTPAQAPAHPIRAAPPADQAARYAVPPQDEQPALWLPRALLFVPRYVLEVPFGVLRGLAWTYDRFQVKTLAQQFFFNEDGTFGVFPTAFFETGFGTNLGARMVHRDLFGRGERMSFRAGYGGQFRQVYELRLRSGDRFGRTLSVKFFSKFNIEPGAYFFGIGNRGSFSSSADAANINALENAAATKTRFSQSVARAHANVVLRLHETLSSNLSANWTRRQFGQHHRDDDHIRVGDVYDTATLVGFSSGTNHLYTELSFLYEDRRPATRFISEAAPSTGWRAEIWGGWVQGLDKDPSRYWRWGSDIIRNIDLYHGDRTLVLRAYIEGVSAPLDEIAFVDLPRLGGPMLLRGHPDSRFRDRAVTLGSAEYLYPLSENFSGMLFVDAGRPFRDIEDFRLRHFRFGIGAGIQAHSLRSFFTRAFVAGSRDGVFALVSFDPLYSTTLRNEW